MPFPGGGFHQPVRAVLGIEPERQPYQQRSRSHAEADAHPLVHARHVQDNEHHEHGKQPGGEHEKVLAFQALELYVPANPLVDFKVHNPLLLQEERAQDRSGDNQENTSSEPRSRRLARIGIAATEFSIYFYTANQPDHRTDGVNQFRSRIEIRSHHLRGFRDTRLSVALCHRTSGSHYTGCHQKESFLCHCLLRLN